MRTRKKYLHNGIEYRSKFEVSMAIALEAAGITFGYEDEILPYTVPETPRKYYPDFNPKGCKYDHVETKGRFTAADRKKMLYVIRNNPGVKILIVFQNPNVKLSKLSKTSYADWCDKHGIDWTTIDKAVSKLRTRNGPRKKRKP